MNFGSEQRLMLRSDSGAKIAALLENAKNHAAVEHHPTAFARASPASTKGGCSLLARWGRLSLLVAPGCPHPKQPGLDFTTHRERPFPHLSHLLLYWEVISDYGKEGTCSLPSLAWRCCRGSAEPRVALPMPPLHEGKAPFGKVAGKKKSMLLVAGWEC